MHTPKLAHQQSREDCEPKDCSERVSEEFDGQVLSQIAEHLSNGDSVVIQ